MTFLQAVALFVAAVLSGTLNSVAGGGSFITFPTLLFTGVLPKSANATSTVALWPGSVASAGGYRHSLTVKRPLLLTLVATSLIGGILGAVLLLLTPQSTFLRLVPYLLLVATLLFAFGGQITARLPKQASLDERQSLRSLAPLAAVQLVIATYSGFFGGGIGILMLAAFALMGMEHIHSMNALKNILASCINGVAVVTFIRNLTPPSQPLAVRAAHLRLLLRQGFMKFARIGAIVAVVLLVMSVLAAWGDKRPVGEGIAAIGVSLGLPGAVFGVFYTLYLLARYRGAHLRLRNDVVWHPRPDGSTSTVPTDTQRASETSPSLP